jgi:hypothetical protein
MEYHEIIKGLYSNDQSQIIKILQRSIYCSQVSKKDETLIITHTGFSFFTHKDKEMEILIGFSSNSNKVITIRQPRAEWNYKRIPLINGLRLGGEGDYFNVILGSMIVKVTELNNDYQLLEYHVKDNPEYFENKPITEIELLDDPIKLIKSINIEAENNGPVEYPLQKRHGEKIYYDGSSFLKYSPINDRDEEDRYDDYEKRPSYEDWLREEFGDDAEGAYWNLD